MLQRYEQQKTTKSKRNQQRLLITYNQKITKDNLYKFWYLNLTPRCTFNYLLIQSHFQQKYRKYSILATSTCNKQNIIKTIIRWHEKLLRSTGIRNFSSEFQVNVYVQMRLVVRRGLFLSRSSYRSTESDRGF